LAIRGAHRADVTLPGHTYHDDFRGALWRVLFPGFFDNGKRCAGCRAVAFDPAFGELERSSELGSVVKSDIAPLTVAHNRSSR
jgi:hypothetical protein